MTTLACFLAARRLVRLRPRVFFFILTTLRASAACSRPQRHSRVSGVWPSIVVKRRWLAPPVLTAMAAFFSLARTSSDARSTWPIVVGSRTIIADGNCGGTRHGRCG